MEAGSTAAAGRLGRSRLWALAPILLLVGVLAVFASTGGSSSSRARFGFA